MMSEELEIAVQALRSARSRAQYIRRLSDRATARVKLEELSDSITLALAEIRSKQREEEKA